MTENLLSYFNSDELAAGTWLRKYAMKDKEGNAIEETPADMHMRMAKELFRIDEAYQAKEFGSKKSNLTEYGKSRENLTLGGIFSKFDKFKAIIPQGSIMAQLGTGTMGSLSNCFVAGQPHDSYGGIMQIDQMLVQLMKRRGGVGTDLSTLRPSGVATTNSAVSSTGAVSFMERFSNSTREVAQNGRRGALMISIDVNHPDVRDFATIKNDPTKVTGANISIFLRNAFMESVESGEDYLLRFPCEESVEGIDMDQFEYDVLTPFTKEDGTEIFIKKVNAKDLYDTVVHSAWNRAEPGQLFIDRFHDYSPDSVYPLYRGVTTNPCSEIFMSAFDACRLMAVNFMGYVKNPFTEDAWFDYEAFYKDNYEAQRLMDNIVDLEIEHIDRILAKIESDPEPEEVKYTELNLWKKIRHIASSGRRTGTGITGLGDALAACGIKYDSDEGLEMIEELMYTKMKSELDCITDLAILRGTFEGWNTTEEFIANEDGTFRGTNSFYQFIQDNYPEQARRLRVYGRRNVSWSTIAPTGTVSLMAQCSSGLEPVFMPYYTRRVKVNPNDKSMRVDFTDQNGDQWMEMPVLHKGFEDWIKIQNPEVTPIELSPKELDEYFEKSPYFGATAPEIDWQRRVVIQGVIQKYISHSISSTINLPNSVTQKEVADIYVASWKEGLKGVTVYRDGSRSGVLVSNDSVVDTKSFDYVDAFKRPKELDGEAHTLTVRGQKFAVIVGMLEGKPYEVFAFPTDDFFKGKGTIKKQKRGAYYFKQGEGEGVTKRVLNEGTSDEETAILRMASTALRHRADIKYIVEQLNKSANSMFSFPAAVARTIKKYIPDGVKGTVQCKNPECTGDGTNVVFEEGCHKCLDCGDSKCG